MYLNLIKETWFSFTKFDLNQTHQKYIIFQKYRVSFYPGPNAVGILGILNMLSSF